MWIAIWRSTIEIQCVDFDKQSETIENERREKSNKKRMKKKDKLNQIKDCVVEAKRRVCVLRQKVTSDWVFHWIASVCFPRWSTNDWIEMICCRFTVAITSIWSMRVDVAIAEKIKNNFGCHCLLCHLVKRQNKHFFVAFFFWKSFRLVEVATRFDICCVHFWITRTRISFVWSQSS